MSSKNTVEVKIINPAKSITDYGFTPKMFDLDYFLIVNGEEVQITREMAYGITGFIDEYRNEIREKLHDLARKL